MLNGGAEAEIGLRSCLKKSIQKLVRRGEDIVFRIGFVRIEIAEDAMHVHHPFAAVA